MRDVRVTLFEFSNMWYNIKGIPPRPLRYCGGKKVVLTGIACEAPILYVSGFLLFVWYNKRESVALESEIEAVC